MSLPDELVREFHQTYACAIRETPSLDVPERLLRRDLITEECEEFEVALDDDDLVGVADALADLVYVIYGAALTFGIPLDRVLEEVHRSNMSKLGADGKPIYREDGKVLKGPGYFEPRIREVLDRPDVRPVHECGIAIGGLYRCCLLNIRSDHTLAAPGDVRKCVHCNSEVVLASDFCWRWKQHSDR